MSEELIDNAKPLSFNDALEALNTASNSFKVEAWVPSIQKFVIFKEIDAKQQKNLLNAAIDTAIYTSDFVKVFFNILKENYISNNDQVSIESLTVEDKAAIAIALRNQISSDINIKFSDETSSKIDLKSIVDKLKVYKTPKPEIVDLQSNNVKIIAKISTPTIKKELEFDENFSKEYKKADEIKNNKELRNLISEAFICEVTKYIDSITVNDAEFMFETLTFNQKIRIIEKLPSGILQKILEKVSDWKSEFNQILTVKHQDLTKVISIDSLLFLS